MLVLFLFRLPIFIAMPITISMISAVNGLDSTAPADSRKDINATEIAIF